MKIAGILLIIAGILMLLGFLFQLPAIIEILKQGNTNAIIKKLLYSALLLAGGITLTLIGRKVRRSTIS